MKNHKIVTMLGLLIAFAGVIVPILRDYVNSRALLQIQVISNTKIIGKVEEFDNIEVIYDGKKYDSISKVEFLLINLGRTPITNDITKVQPYISLGPEVNILQTKITKTVPDKITCSLKINKDSIIIVSTITKPK